MPPTDADTAFRAFEGSKSSFDREAVAALQKAGPEFGDIVAALRIKDELEAASAYTEAEHFKRLKGALRQEGVGPSKRADQAIRLCQHYCLIDGLLHREVLDSKDNAFVQRVVVPAGGLRSFHFNGRQYRLSLRKAMLLLYHDSELIGAHPGVRDTLAKLADLFWWPGMEHEVRRWVATCATCRLVKPTPALTAEQRMELHDRPFRVLFIDAIGPIRPADGEYQYLAHCECPYSRFPWLAPLRDDSEEEWARFLVEQVFFDLAGFPAVLRSDRGTAFTGGVIRAVNTLLGITHAFGSAYHPESQGYIESRHKFINTTLAAYARDNPGSWAKRAKLAQWAMRATPRADRDGRSPYELITGLKPQGPLHRVFQKMSREAMAPSEYIRDLNEHLKSVHDSVKTYVAADFENKKSKEEGRSSSAWLPQVGDIVLLRRPPPAVQASQGQKGGTVSKRLTPLADTRPFRVHKQVGPKAYILADPDTGSTELGFQQPVALARLIAFEMAALETPTNAEQQLWIDIKSNKSGRENDWVIRRIIGQQATGKVRVQSRDQQQEEVIDLASFEWRWRNAPRDMPAPPPRTAAPLAAAVLAMDKFDPLRSDRNSPYAHPSAGDTASWRIVFEDFLKVHRRTQLAKLDELLVMHYGKEKGYYDELVAIHQGPAKCQKDKVDLWRGQCRLCHEYGHWGNECPERKPGIVQCSTQRPRKKHKAESKEESNMTVPTESLEKTTVDDEPRTIPPWQLRQQRQQRQAQLTQARQTRAQSAPPTPAAPAATPASIARPTRRPLQGTPSTRTVNAPPIRPSSRTDAAVAIATGLTTSARLRAAAPLGASPFRRVFLRTPTNGGSA